MITGLSSDGLLKIRISNILFSKTYAEFTAECNFSSGNRIKSFFTLKTKKCINQFCTVELSSNFSLSLEDMAAKIGQIL